MTVTRTNRGLVESFYEAVGGDLVQTLSGDRMVALGELLAGSVTDDFECVMISSFGSNHYQGLDGFAGAWRDWLEPYSSFNIELEGMIEAGTALLQLVTQRGVTRHDEVEIENASGALWHFRGDRLERVEFYLEQDAAREAAGL